MILKENILLKPYSTFKIGSKACYFQSHFQERSEIEALFDFTEKKNTDLRIVGCASNLLFSDEAIDGIVYRHVQDTFLEPELVREDDDKVVLDVLSSTLKVKLLEYSSLKNYGGLEFSAGIPGTLGGAIFMNAGTKWGSYSQVVESVECFSKQESFFVLDKNKYSFSYRNFDAQNRKYDLIYKIRISLKKNSFDSNKVNEILKYRGLKQALEFPNCGSIFKNPPVEVSKIGAGRLIEKSGLKGTQIGGARVSLKHANFIHNVGNASALDVKNLILLIQKEIKNQFNVSLHRELIYFVD